MERCKVLFVTRWYPTRERSWSGTFVQDWSSAAAQVADVAVLHLIPGGPGALREETRADDSVPVFRLPIAWRGARSPVWHLRDQLAAAAAIEQLHSERGFDLLHAHAYVAATAARLGARRCRIPYVVTEHFSRLIDGTGKWFHLAEARYALSGAAWVTAVGPAVQNGAGNLSKRAVEVLPNPVPACFTLAPRRGGGSFFRLLSIGRLERVKGYDIGLEALASLGSRVDVRWTIAGEGPERSNLEEQARSLGLGDRVDFLGPIHRHAVHEQMSRADAVLVPSRTETFSMVAAEALMTGRPVIATRSGGPDGFVGPAEGRLVPVEDPVALGKAIETVLTNLDGFPPSRVAAAARVRFSEEAIAARLGDIYRDVGGCG